MKNKLIFLGLAFISSLIFVLMPTPTPIVEIKPDGAEILVGNTIIKVDVADTPALREQGLSGRSALVDGGLLFVFEMPGNYGFWMKDMRFPIDIVWINEQKKVVGVDVNISPDTYPRIFSPSEAIRYVVELPANFTTSHKIKVGDTFSLVTHNQ